MLMCMEAMGGLGKSAEQQVLMDIDKVAQAIWGADRCRVHGCPRKAWGWEALGDRQQDIYRRMAQAAIEASADQNEKGPPGAQPPGNGEGVAGGRH